MAMKKGVKALLAEANALIKTYPVAEAIALHAAEGAIFVDVRDVRELEYDGIIPGAVHAPRGMIEFWVDRESPYFRPVFGQDKEYVFFCAVGWRSALVAKTLQDMGIPNVAHVDGGFAAWQAAGGPVAEMGAEAGAEKGGKKGDKR